ncbi:signal peptide peptidase SppA [Nocardioidaceae bacterium SCSIO 66511]|nr:signal peptide peptidase SppA [Nocardioidaceae bacterium SCSIO 66511]
MKTPRLPFTDRAGLPLVVEIDLTRGLLAHAPTDPLSALRARNTPSLAETLAGLRYAADDPQVAGVIVTISDSVPIAQAEELGAALEEFALSGKPTLATATSFGELGPGSVAYYLALHTDAIWLQPSGGVALMGVALDVMTLRGVLDKIDAEPQLGQRHEFKTAAEQIMSREISAPNREMTQRIADSVVDRIASVAARRRGLDAASFEDAMATAPVPAPIAVQRGLVDHLGYRSDAYAHARREWGRDGEVALRYAHRYARHRANRPTEQLRRRGRPKIGVVSVSGGITTGRTGGSPFGGRTAGSESICAAIRLATDDESLRGLILRVDSPGGSYVASDAIRHALREFRATDRPVVASMAGVAASGGYFVSMPCDAIVALPSTLTGSIGVLGGKVALGRTFERIGVTAESIGSGAHATMFSSTSRFDDAQWAKVNDWLDEVYADFTTKAAEDRGMDVSTLESLARGRVWTGADACDRGLVDQLGGLRTALDTAAERAGVAADQVRAVPVPHVSALQRLIPSESSESPGDAVATSPEGLLVGAARAAGLTVSGVLALPWRLTIT